MPTIYESLREDNQFSFTCPVFNSQTRMGACVKLRDMVYAGKKPDVRRGCQAAMECGKCPAAEMVRSYCFDKTWTNDHHGSLVPKEGKLMKPLLEKVRRVMMRENAMVNNRISDVERHLLDTANDRIDAQLRTAPGESSRRGTTFEPSAAPARRKVMAPPPITTPSNEAINHAAASGDLAAAINA